MRVLLMLAFMIQQGGYLRWLALLFVAFWAFLLYAAIR